jgi:sugar lactone lactonase YvrE
VCSFLVSFPLSGVTVAGYGNGTSGNTNYGLATPWGLALDVNDILYVGDYANSRVTKYQAGSLNGSVVAGTGVSGSLNNQLQNPTEIAVDLALNVYVNDDYNYRVMRWGVNAISGIIVAGDGTYGNTANTISDSVGLAIDSQRNLYVSEQANHRVMKWDVNATSGIVVAGTTGVPGSTNQLLNQPYGLYLDEQNSYIYIADFGNSRIQRYTLGITTTGTTVAGGNGVGAGNQQLNSPYGMCVSQATGDIYIADTSNDRIQRWSPGATSGVTVIGITGVTGTNATLISGPLNVVLSKDETSLYVSDSNNHRVQRYQLT